MSSQADQSSAGGNGAPPAGPGAGGGVNPPPAPPPPGDPLKEIGARVTTLGGIVAAVVAVSASISSCSKDNVERYGTFRTAVASEEKYWDTLYDEYLATFDAPPAGTDADAYRTKQQEKRAAIQALTSHHVPDFKEHQLGLLWRATAPQMEAKKNLEAIKSSLIDALSRSSDPAISGSTQAAIFAADEAQKIVAQPGTAAAAAPAPPVVVQPVVQAGPVISYQSQTLSSGKPSGWNVDVFWCAGEHESYRYSVAGAIAQALGNVANGDGKLPGSGQVLGRIRLRSLPADLQGKGYPTGGTEIRANADERSFADALNAYIFRSSSTRFGISTVRTPTPSYLSVFVCHAPPPS